MPIFTPTGVERTAQQVEQPGQFGWVAMLNALAGGGSRPALAASPGWAAQHGLNDATLTMVDGTLYLSPVWLPTAATITGVKYFTTTQGNFTGDNNNVVGLYKSVYGSTRRSLSLVASCADDANIFKQSSTTWSYKDFSSTYAAAAGLYYAAFLYNNSAQTTAPVLGVPGAQTTAGDNTGLAAYGAVCRTGYSITGQTALPTTPVAFSNATATPLVVLY